ncbi:PREDICTED: kinase-interacting family protein-like [Nelumbo nucifera]|uniref:Kinase-interacting family protein-like n=1 Tax=Nelumbo nucifera TaxID=4432 RepID=A0A1U8B8B5_NELNU|nr:PREDICTED: kinase-interacting family protein-like [Nelumbo nucifera]
MTTPTLGSSLQPCRSHSRPSWLHATLTDLEDKVKSLALSLPKEDESDSFAERAENYYRKRPQLLTLVQDLYNGYVSLADRYCQSVTKNQISSQLSVVTSDIDEDGDNQIDSDAESSLSYQPPPPQSTTEDAATAAAAADPDALVAELVSKTIDYEILLNEMTILEKCNTESSRKIELQKSLLEVLESERLILLNENARLGFRVSALTEENKGLATESAFMKRKASELARCVLKMRDDHRVCLLSRKIEDLQGQIYGLEKRNKEYYEQLVKREEQEKKKKEMALEVCFEVEKLKLENEQLREKTMRAGDDGRHQTSNSSSRWWDRVRKLETLLLCGSPGSTPF